MRSVALVALGAAAALGGCGDIEHDFRVVPTLPACVPMGSNEVKVSALGDFPPAPSRTTIGSSLDLPATTRVLELDGLSQGLVAFGRTAPFDVAKLSSTIAVNFGAPDTLCPTADMHYARAGHRATLLASGEVLVSGGHDLSGFPVPKLEAYVPYSAPPSFRVVDADGPTVLDARAALGHAVAVLPGGDFFITGGVHSQATKPFGVSFVGFSHHNASGVQVATGVFSGDGRAFHTATVLPDGRFVLLGGCARFDAGGCASDGLLASSVIYDKGQFSDGPPLAHARSGHQAFLRGDGKLLVVGGGAPAELFDPASGGSDLVDLEGLAALLPTGALLAVDSASAKLFVGGELVALSPLPGAADTLTPLEDGAVLAAGDGLALIDPISGPRSLAASFGRRDHSATLLGDGSVLIAGGSDSAAASTQAAIYLHSPLGPYANLSTLTFDTPQAPIVPARPDRVRFTGGHLEITDTFVLLAALQLTNFTLTLLADGNAEVLVGWQSDVRHATLLLQQGQPVSLTAPAGTFTGDALGSNEISITWRVPNFIVSAGGKQLLQCRPNLDRGAIGLGASQGTATFDDVALTR
jgi:hypothetical protein